MCITTYKYDKSITYYPIDVDPEIRLLKYEQLVYRYKFIRVHEYEVDTCWQLLYTELHIVVAGWFYLIHDRTYEPT